MSQNKRARVANQIRSFLIDRGFEEMIPLLVSAKVPNEATIVPFQLQSPTPAFLATSPERFLKLAMSKGTNDCFAISPTFRAMEGEGRWHQSEFLMVEWYQFGANQQKMIRLTQDLVASLWQELPQIEWPQLSWSKLWLQYVGTDWLDLVEDQKMIEFARNRGYNPDKASWEQLFYQIGFNEIMDHVPNEPCFLTQFPAKISPLCKQATTNRLVAERFELLINRVEIADGNEENLNGASLTEMNDLEFVEAIEKLDQRAGNGLAGVGLGIDRLIALKLDSTVGKIQGR